MLLRLRSGSAESLWYIHIIWGSRIQNLEWWEHTGNKEDSPVAVFCSTKNVPYTVFVQYVCKACPQVDAPMGRIAHVFFRPLYWETLAFPEFAKFTKLAKFAHIVTRFPKFAKLMRNTLSRVQPPWSIVIYADGITPQDPLSKTDERKIDTVYWSFLEFADALVHEEVWLVLTCARTNELKKIDGGCFAISFSMRTATTSLALV